MSATPIRPVIELAPPAPEQPKVIAKPTPPPPKPQFMDQLRMIQGADYDKHTAMAEAGAIMLAAAEERQFGPALAAAKLRAEIAGLLIQRKEIGRPGEFRGISDEDLSMLIEEDLSKIGVEPEAAKKLSLAALDED